MSGTKLLTAVISGLVVLVFALRWAAVSAVAQQELGRGVRIKVERNQEIDLYAESHALVIGVSEYGNGWKKLPGAKRDVTEVSAALRKQGFEVESLLDPTRSQLDERLRTFISEHGLAERNRLLVYFAGHGFTEKVVDGRQLGYIVPVDAPLPARNPRQFSARAISMNEMETYASRIKSKHALFVFDSCFSGTLFETMRSTRTVPPAIESKTAAPVRFFITAGTDGQEVPDESLFRAWFVRALDGEGDLDNDGFVTGEELGMFLSGRVARESREAQTPRFGKIRDGRLNIGDFVFALPKRERKQSGSLIASSETTSDKQVGLLLRITDSKGIVHELKDIYINYPSGFGPSREKEGIRMRLGQSEFLLKWTQIKILRKFKASAEKGTDGSYSVEAEVVLNNGETMKVDLVKDWSMGAAYGGQGLLFGTTRFGEMKIDFPGIRNLIVVNP